MSKTTAAEIVQGTVNISGEADKPKETLGTCFVIMPISDQPGYEPDHFSRVYEEIMVPAIETAGFKPERADSPNQTHNIIVSILKAIVNSDMAICDISSLNPNVMYELGIRQMAQKPVVLLKDRLTKNIFDISILKYIEYDSNLRVDHVRHSIASISSAIKNTFENKEEKSNSLLDLLGTDVQIQKRTVEITGGEELILNKLERLLMNQPLAIGRSRMHAPFESSKFFSMELYPGDAVMFKSKREYSEYDGLKIFLQANASHFRFADVATTRLDIIGPATLNGKVTTVEKIIMTDEYLSSLDEQTKANIKKIEAKYGVLINLPF